MTSAISILPCTLLGVASLFCSAQGPAGDWDLQSCLEYAKKNNIQLNTLRLSQEINRETLLQAKAGLYPSLSGVVTQTYLHSNGANAEIAGTGVQNSVASGYSLGSAWTAYNAGYLRDNVKLQAPVIPREKYKMNHQSGMLVEINLSREDLANLVGTAKILNGCPFPLPLPGS